MHRAHLAPVGVQFLGQDHGQGGQHTLAELQAVDGDGHRAIWGNVHERAGLIEGFERCGTGLFAFLRQCALREDAQREARCHTELEEAAPGQTFIYS